jgi:hypothetical protein
MHSLFSLTIVTTQILLTFILTVIIIFRNISDLDIVESLKTYLEVKSDLERSLSNLVPPSDRDRQEINRLRRVSKKSQFYDVIFYHTMFYYLRYSYTPLLSTYSNSSNIINASH